VPRRQVGTGQWARDGVGGRAVCEPWAGTRWCGPEEGRELEDGTRREAAAITAAVDNVRERERGDRQRRHVLHVTLAAGPAEVGTANTHDSSVGSQQPHSSAAAQVCGKCGVSAAAQICCGKARMFEWRVYYSSGKRDQGW
jgi:hypothetical protein